MGFVFVPDKKIMDDVIIDSVSSIGVKAFDSIMDLESIGACQTFIPSQMADRLNKRLKEEHQASFYSHVEIDYSTKGLDGFDSYTSYQYLVPKKAINLKDTVVFVAHDVSIYNIPQKDNIIMIDSSAFVEKVKYIMKLVKQIRLLSYEEVITAVLRN